MERKIRYFVNGLVFIGIISLVLSCNIKSEREQETVFQEINHVSATEFDASQSSPSENEATVDVTKSIITDIVTSSISFETNSENYVQPSSSATQYPTPDPTQFVESVEIEDYSKSYWEERLYKASLKFLAETPDQADKVSRSLGYLNSTYESASNVCGPLSIAIMKEAGFFPLNTNVKPAWLLCAREREDCNGINVLKSLFFPPRDYDYYFFNENIRTYDFISNPLQPGDFIYLFSGSTGYDHMIVVTRVDGEGAAYSVTNADRGLGYIIQEELLYHPTNAQKGFFYEFTEPSRGMLGMTGNGGMLLIRRKNGLESLPILNDYLDHTLDQNTRWSIIVREIGQNQSLFENYPNLTFHPASLIEIPIAMVAMNILENLGTFPNDFNEVGFGGWTFEQLFYAMIVNSEENATEILTDFIHANGGEKTVLESWQVNETSFFPRRSTPYDLANILEGLYNDQFIDPDMRAYLLSLMTVITENDTQYLGSVTTSMRNSTFYNKRGLLLSPTIVSEMGILTMHDRAFVVIVSGTPEHNSMVTFEEIKTSIEDFAEALGPALLSLSKGH